MNILIRHFEVWHLIIWEDSSELNLLQEAQGCFFFQISCSFFPVCLFSLRNKWKSVRNDSQEIAVAKANVLFHSFLRFVTNSCTSGLWMRMSYRHDRLDKPTEFMNDCGTANDLNFTFPNSHIYQNEKSTVINDICIYAKYVYCRAPFLLQLTCSLFHSYIILLFCLKIAHLHLSSLHKEM